MATGGWGYSVNPFAQGGSATAPPAPAEEAPRQQNAFGAWGGGVGTAAPAPAASPKPNALAAAFNIAPGGGGGGGGAGGGNLAQREAELARREAELARREAALAQIAENSKPSNFPPFCPFMYHSISEQIPAWNRSMIRFTFVIELLEILGFIYNTIILLAAMFTGIVGLQWWLFSVIAFTTGLPLSWWMFYKSLFRAAQTDGATYPYVRSMLTILINLAWCVWMVLGLNGLGEFSGGIFPMLKLFQAGGAQNTTFAILYIVNVVIWGLAGVGSFFTLGAAIAAYRRGAGPRRDYEARYGPSELATV